jgi:hypothetical protein
MRDVCVMHTTTLDLDDEVRVPGKFLRTVAAVDHGGLRRRPLVILSCQAIAQGLVILTPDPAITCYPLPTAW